MNENEAKIFKEIKDRFVRIQTSKKLSVEEETDLMNDTTVLIGFFTIRYDPELYKLLQEMLDFSESRNLSMLSQRMGFEYAMQKHRRV